MKGRARRSRGCGSVSSDLSVWSIGAGCCDRHGVRSDCRRATSSQHRRYKCTTAKEKESARAAEELAGYDTRSMSLRPCGSAAMRFAEPRSRLSPIADAVRPERFLSAVHPMSGSGPVLGRSESAREIPNGCCAVVEECRTCITTRRCRRSRRRLATRITRSMKRRRARIRQRRSSGAEGTARGTARTRTPRSYTETGAGPAWYTSGRRSSSDAEAREPLFTSCEFPCFLPLASSPFLWRSILSDVDTRSQKRTRCAGIADWVR